MTSRLAHWAIFLKILIFVLQTAKSMKQMMLLGPINSRATTKGNSYWIEAQPKNTKEIISLLNKKKAILNITILFLLSSLMSHLSSHLGNFHTPNCAYCRHSAYLPSLIYSYTAPPLVRCHGLHMCYNRATFPIVYSPAPVGEA